MRQNLKTLALIGQASAVMVLSLGVGCSGKKIDENDPAALMQEAEDDIKNDHYQIAIDKLRIIKNKFPYSKLSIDAQLRIADVYFLQESFGEAALAYESFRDLHPKHEQVSYAMFRIGKSYFKDTPSHIARDLTPATKALEAYQEFLKRFSGDPNAEESRKNIAEIRSILAEKELSIANFYYKRLKYSSAQNRLQKVLDLYPETPSAQEAQSKLKAIGEKVK